MPIEFQCESCGNKLRVPDTAAGKRAKCPSCEKVVTIPTASPGGPPAAPTGGADPFAPLPSVGAANPFADPAPGSQPIPGQQSTNPFAGPQPAAQQDSSNPFQSPEAVGELPLHQQQLQAGEIVPSRIDFGDVLNRTWSIYTSNFQKFVPFALVAIAVNVIGFLVMYFLMGDVQAKALQQLQNRRPGVQPVLPDFPVAIFPVMFCLGLIGFWIYVGQFIYVLKICRGQSATVSDIFSGGPRFLPALGLYILQGVAIVIGLIFCLAPGIFLGLMWLVSLPLLIDRNMGVGESFTASMEIMKGNKGTAFAILLVAFIAAALFGGILSFGLGVIASGTPSMVVVVGILDVVIRCFTMLPLSLILFAVIYLSATGQAVVTGNR